MRQFALISILVQRSLVSLTWFYSAPTVSRASVAGVDQTHSVVNFGKISPQNGPSPKLSHRNSPTINHPLIVCTLHLLHCVG